VPDGLEPALPRISGFRARQAWLALVGLLVAGMAVLGPSAGSLPELPTGTDGRAAGSDERVELPAAADPGGTRSPDEATTGELESGEGGCFAPGCLVWSVGPEPPIVPTTVPTVGGGLLLVRWDGRLAALELRTGEVRWEFDPATEHERLGTGDLVYAATDELAVVLVEDELLALELTDGSERWRVGVSEPSRVGDAIELDDVVVVSSARRVGPSRGDVEVLALDAGTGRPRWSRSVADAALSDRGPVVLTSEAVLQGLDPVDGAVRWERSLDDGLDQLDASGELVITRPVAGGRQDTTIRSAVDGEVLLERSHGVNAQLRTATRGTLVAPLGDEIALLTDGEVRWRRDTGPVPCCAGTYVDEEVVTVRRTDGSLWVLDREDGAPVADLADPTPDAPPHRTTLVGRFVFTVDGFDPSSVPTVRVVDAASGAPVADLVDAFPAYQLADGDVIVLGAGRVARLTPEGSDRLGPRRSRGQTGTVLGAEPSTAASDPG
jgi:outer membrane protein assembly factor BamB